MADSLNNRIREIATNGIITTVVGGGTNFPGDGFAGTNASLNLPLGLVTDSFGNIFIADTGNNRVRKLISQGPAFSIPMTTLASQSNFDVIVTSPFGSVTSSMATIIQGFAPYIVSQPLSQITTANSNVSFTVVAAASGFVSYQWYFNGMSLPGSTSNTLSLTNISVGSCGNYQVIVTGLYGTAKSSLATLSLLVSNSVINLSAVVGGTAVLSANITGGGPLTYQWQLNGTNLPENIITTVAGNGTNGFFGDGGPAINAELYRPEAMTCDAAGNVFISDTGNNRIRKIDGNGIISTVAGGAAGFSGDGGFATNALLSAPKGLCIDNQGNLLFADCVNNRIRKISPSGIINTVAGEATILEEYSADGGPAIDTPLSIPQDVAVDALGNLFIADLDDARVREVKVDGTIITVMGFGLGYPDDLPVNNGISPLNVYVEPVGVAVDSLGAIYEADTARSTIRKASVGSYITTVAGGGRGGDGVTATNAALYIGGFDLSGFTVDSYGQLFICDDASKIRKVGQNGIITTFAGSGMTGYNGDGIPATNAYLGQPHYAEFDLAGNLLIADTYNNRVRKVIVQGPVLVLTNLTSANSGNYRVIVTSSSNSIISAVTYLNVILPPQNLQAVYLPGQGLQITFTGSPVSSYILQATTNLALPASWQSIVTNSTDTNGNWSYVDPTALTNTAEFYRAYLP